MKNWFAFGVFLLLPNLSQAFEVPAIQGKIHNYTPIKTSELRVIVRWDCRTNAFAEPCGSGTSTAEVREDGSFKTKRMSHTRLFAYHVVGAEISAPGYVSVQTADTQVNTSRETAAALKELSLYAAPAFTPRFKADDGRDLFKWLSGRGDFRDWIRFDLDPIGIAPFSIDGIYRKTLYHLEELPAQLYALSGLHPADQRIPAKLTVGLSGEPDLFSRSYELEFTHGVPQEIQEITLNVSQIIETPAGNWVGQINRGGNGDLNVKLELSCAPDGQASGLLTFTDLGTSTPVKGQCDNVSGGKLSFEFEGKSVTAVMDSLSTKNLRGDLVPVKSGVRYARINLERK